jgi:hypothetical protein
MHNVRNFLPNRFSIAGLLRAPCFAKARHNIHNQTPEYEQRQAVGLMCGEPCLDIPLACTGENFLHNAWVYRRKPDRQPVRRERCGEEFAC